MADDRFTGRWDDPDGIWRDLYVGDNPAGHRLKRKEAKLLDDQRF